MGDSNSTARASEQADSLVRACLLKDAWSAIEHEDAVVRAAVGPPPPVVAQAAALDWLPASLGLLMDEQIAAAAGLRAVEGLRRRAFLLSASRPLLRPLRDGAIKLFGPRPSSLFRWARHGWDMSMRRLGKVRYDEAERGCRLIFTGVPARFAVSEPWRAALSGTLHGMLEAVERSGDVRLHVDGDALVFRVCWSRTTSPTSPSASL
jgi:hypothetical protein